MAGYLFGGNTGISYSDLQRRREIADALSKQIMGDTPKTTAQGIGALMKGIGAGIGRYSANKGLKEGTDSANSAYESILGRIMGGSPSAAPSVASSGGGAGGGAIPMPGAAYEVAATSPTTGDTLSRSLTRSKPVVCRIPTLWRQSLPRVALKVAGRGKELSAHGATPVKAGNQERLAASCRGAVLVIRHLPRQAICRRKVRRSSS